MSAKTTSLQKMTEALSQFGWEVEVTEVPVAVPDPTKGYRGAIKHVSGYRVSAKNGVASGAGDYKDFDAEFTEDGKYLAPNTRGRYPFQSGESLATLLKNVDFYSAKSQQERAQRRAASDAEDLAKEQEAVAASYAAAKEAQQGAYEEVAQYLVDACGLTRTQLAEVLASAEDGLVAAYVAAKVNTERAGRGFATGKSWVRGTYEDGVLVSAV